MTQGNQCARGGRRAGQLGLVTAVVIGLLCGCRTRIQHGLDERQANELQKVLAERGFEARKVSEQGRKPSWAIEVDDDHAADAVRVLAELGLPRARSPSTLDILAGSKLVPTAAEERARQVLGLAGDLAQTLEAVDGVTSARVHLVLPTPPKGGQMGTQAKASAFLRVRPGAAEQIRQARDELRALVAGAVEGLSPENVTLVVSEVASSVPAPVPGPSPATRLRALVVVLGAALSVLALGVVYMGLKMRRLRAGEGESSSHGQAPPVRTVSARRAA